MNCNYQLVPEMVHRSCKAALLHIPWVTATTNIFGTEVSKLFFFFKTEGRGRIKRAHAKDESHQCIRIHCNMVTSHHTCMGIQIHWIYIGFGSTVSDTLSLSLRETRLTSHPPRWIHGSDIVLLSTTSRARSPATADVFVAEAKHKNSRVSDVSVHAK